MRGRGSLLRKQAHSADAIVVLGGGVEADGSLPQVALSRVRQGVALYHSGIAPRLILTGRCGLTTPLPVVTEAAAMAEYALSHGVPESAILLEEEARDTLGNAYFTREMFLAPNGWMTIRVVTSDFHLSRAAWVFRKILGDRYDFSFVSAYSGLTPSELILRALEECKLSIFLNEWLEALGEGDEDAILRLMAQEHPGYADAPTLTHEQMQARLDEIAHINRIAGTQRWIAEGDPGAFLPSEVRAGRRRGVDRRRTARND